MFLFKATVLRPQEITASSNLQQQTQKAKSNEPEKCVPKQDKTPGEKIPKQMNRSNLPDREYNVMIKYMVNKWLKSEGSQ